MICIEYQEAWYIIKVWNQFMLIFQKLEKKGVVRHPRRKEMRREEIF